MSRKVLLLIAGLAGGLAVPAPIARAQSVVTNTADSGAGSLRNALTTAVPDEGITFSLGVMNPVISVPLPASPLELQVDRVRIDGEGAGLEIQGSDPDVTYLRLLGGEVTIVDVDQSRGKIALDGVLTYETTRPTTLDVSIVDEPLGTGSLFKTGAGTLTLTRTNTYSGETRVIEGVLRGPAAAFPGDVLNGARLIFDQPQDPGDPLAEFVYSGVIDDLDADSAGIVEKQGDGILRLDGGPQGWSGGTIVRGGTLIFSESSPLNPDGDIQIQSGATLSAGLTPATTTTWGGALSGAGTLQVAGDTSTLTLSTGNFSGTLAYDGAPNGLTVLDPANVVKGAIQFSDADDVFRLTSGGLLTGAISGPGTLQLDPGAGNSVLLGGANSHARTEIASGIVTSSSISLSGDVDLASGAELDILSGGNPLTATVTGAGVVAIVGSQSLSVAVDQPYTGPTEVRSGALALDADLTGTPMLTVSAPGTLAGSGNAPMADLQVSGTVQPSVNSDPITVNTATFAPGSALRMGLRDDGTSAQLATNLALDASGATLVVDPQSGDYRAPVNATLLTAGTLTGVPTLSTGNLAFLTVTPSVVGNTYTVSVQGDLNNIATFAQTPNQLAVADDLQSQYDAFVVSPSPDPEWTGFFDAFNVLAPGEVAPVFDALSGEVYTAIPSAHLATADRFARSLHRRSRGASWASGDAILSLAGRGAGEPDLASAASAAQREADSASGLRSRSALDASPSSLWFEGWGELAELDGGGDASNVDLGLAGATVGLDHRFDSGFGIGLAVGYTYADIDVSHLPDDATAQGVQSAIYGGWSASWGYLSGAGRFSWARNHVERDIDVGSFAAKADADYDTTGYGAGGEAGVNLAQLGPVSLVPFASLDWTRLDSDQVEEGGGGVLSLRVEGDTTDSVRSEVGMRIGTRLRIDESATMLPELRGSWRHEYGDTERELSTELEGSFTGVPIRIIGAQEPRDAAVVGLGWSARIWDQVEAHAEYDAIVDSDGLDHVLAITARIHF